MGFFGTLVNVAKVGVSIANSLLNPPPGVEIQHGKGKEFHCELDDGKKWSILVKYVVVHPNPKFVGKSFAVGKVGDISTPGDPNENPIADNSVVFQAAQDEDNNTKIFAINTTTTEPYQLSFATTDSSGETPTPTLLVPVATNKFKPEWVDISSEYNDHVNGNIAVSPANLTASADLLALLAHMGIKSEKATLPTSTLLGNFGINTIIASATYKLVNVGSQTVTWGWLADNTTHAINGTTVTNTGTADVTISVTLNWNNPTNTFNFTFTATGSGTNGGVTVYNFPETTNGPISNASIAVSQATTPTEQKAIFKAMLDQQRAAGKMYSVKYMYL